MRLFARWTSSFYIIVWITITHLARKPIEAFLGDSFNPDYANYSHVKEIYTNKSVCQFFNAQNKLLLNNLRLTISSRSELRLTLNWIYFVNAKLFHVQTKNNDRMKNWKSGPNNNSGSFWMIFLQNAE